jgi:hypothetical protein
VVIDCTSTLGGTNSIEVFEGITEDEPLVRAEKSFKLIGSRKRLKLAKPFVQPTIGGVYQMIAY